MLTERAADTQTCHLAVDSLSFRHSGRSPWLLRDVSFKVRPGELTVIEGQNGSGKSTLLELCAGLRKPTSGSVRRGVRFSYLPQISGSLQRSLSGIEHAHLFGAACGKSSAEAVKAVAAPLEALRFPLKDLSAQVSKLSGGTRQKLSLALALLDDRAQMLLLDEPYAGFDAESLLAMMSLFSRLLLEGKSIVMVNHLTDPRIQIDETIRLGAS